MFGRNDVSDKDLAKTVVSRVSRTGTGSRISATVNRGVVTLMGKLKYAGQRLPIVNAASRIAGIRQVVDQMQVAPKPSPVLPKAPPKTIAPVKQEPLTEEKIELDGHDVLANG